MSIADQVLRGKGLELSRGGQKLIDAVDLELRPGELHVVLGANGAGKTTLLRVLAGERLPDRGEVQLNGRPIGSWPPRDRARLRAVLSQFDGLQADFTAAEVVALGRYPCPRQAAGIERQRIADALRRVGALQFAGRRYLELSGGERRRVQLARALAQLGDPAPAQAPRYLLLDEPTASLDLAHQHRVLQLARTVAGDNIGVLAILHDPGLAMRYADRITLLLQGRAIAHGTAEEVLTPASLRQVYGVEIELLPAGASQRPAILVRGVPAEADDPPAGGGR